MLVAMSKSVHYLYRPIHNIHKSCFKSITRRHWINAVHNQYVCTQTHPPEKVHTITEQSLYDIHKPENKYEILSPLLANTNLSNFIDKKVVYLIVFEFEGVRRIKFGWSANFMDRFASHEREIPFVIGIGYIVETPDPVKTEARFKEYMKFANKLVNLRMKNKNQTEILQNISLDEAVSVLNESVKYCSRHEEAMQSVDHVEIYRIKTHARIEECRIVNEPERLRAEAEKNRVDIERSRVVFDLLDLLVANKKDLSLRSFKKLERIISKSFL